MRAEIIAVGTELLMGETQDTNSSWMGSHLPELGLELQFVTIVGDNITRLTETIERAWRRSEVVFTIGGLGPTLDDMTRDGIAAVLGEKITIDPDLKEWLEANFRSRNINPMPPQNLRQASIIPSAKAIHNPMGTAPSWWIERDNKILATLPGPPREMMNMWTSEMVPRIKERVPGNIIMSRTFKTIGLSEAAVDEMVGPAYDIPGMDLGVYAKPDGIQVRAIANAATEAEALKTLLTAEEFIRGALGTYIWGTGEDLPPETLGTLLKENKLTLAVLESCTGGLIGGAITEVPGSSDYFKGGAITYTEEMKVQAGVSAKTIADNGVVSEQTAAAMADAARATFGADCGIGVTGVAGPDDQGDIKAGTVYIGVAHPGGTSVEKYQFPSRRPLVRGRAVTAALLQLTKALQGD
jgi:nicotinamide-nucleotide amidase